MKQENGTPVPLKQENRTPVPLKGKQNSSSVETGKRNSSSVETGKRNSSSVETEERNWSSVIQNKKMEVLGYIASILIGLSLGMVGSGGSILTVPVLVYLMGVNPLLATTSSLFIVGITSLVGGIRAYGKRQVDFKAVTEFGIPSIFSIFITRHYILPELPEHLFSIGTISVSKEMFLMVVFALLMLAASIVMIRSGEKNTTIKENTSEKHEKVVPLMLLGLCIGVITGLLGAGGGFLIIPTLVLFLKLPMKRAIGTSLLIVAVNSLFGFLFSLKQFEYNWTLLIIFTLLSIVGIFTGSRVADKISAASLKKGFGWFVLIMGIWIIIKEIFLRQE